MASKGRIDDKNRMLVYKRTSFHTRLNKRLMNDEERARMMGFPERYFRPPLHALYSALAVAFTYNNEVMDHYIGQVPEKFYCFQGEDIAVRRKDSGGGGCGIAVELNPPSLPPYDIEVSREKEKRHDVAPCLRHTCLRYHLPLTLFYLLDSFLLCHFFPC
jgi:hypothetical protein